MCPDSTGNATTRPSIPSRSITTAGFSWSASPFVLVFASSFALLAISCLLDVLGILLLVRSGRLTSSSLSFKSGLGVAFASVTR